MAPLDSDLIRYKRQIMYPGFGEEGQRKLGAAHVVIAGVGGLGCAAATYLACAGVGHITIIDPDWVELSNLNRQVLHWQRDIGRKKIMSAARKLIEINPHVRVTSFGKSITSENAASLIRGASVVLDGLDNFESRLALNAACYAERVPLVHAGVHGLMGEATSIIPGKTPCLECVLPAVQRKQDGVPVFGVISGVMAVIQVAEALKMVAGFGNTLAGRMLYVDLENARFSLARLSKRRDCGICGGVKGRRP